MDRSGRVIGVVVRKSPSENLNVAVAIEQVLAGSEQAATDAGRLVYRLPTGVTSDAAQIDEQFTLPRTLPDFMAALQEAATRADLKIREAYIARHGERTFPNGEQSTQLLHSLYVSLFPRLITEKDDGLWSVNEPQTRRAQLEANGFVDIGTLKFGDLIRLRAPDGVGLATLYGDSKLFMDYVLKGIALRRPIGQDSVRVTSLGKAAEDTTYVDAYGRIWQLRTWPIPFSDSIAMALTLPTPDGCGGFVVRQPSAQRVPATRELQGLTGFVYVSLEGTLARWRDYLAQGALLPPVLRTVQVKTEPGHQVRILTPRLQLTVTSDVQKVSDDSVLIAKFGYFTEGGATVWDIGGVFLADTDQRGNYVDVIRRARPVAGLPESYARRWQSLLDGTHPYTATMYATNGATHIDVASNADDLRAGRAGVGYTLSVVREGTETQEQMAARLKALRTGFRMLEH